MNLHLVRDFYGFFAAAFDYQKIAKRMRTKHHGRQWHGQHTNFQANGQDGAHLYTLKLIQTSKTAL